MFRNLLFLLFLTTIVATSCVDLEENDTPELEDILVRDGEIEKINTGPGDKTVSIGLTGDLQLNVRIHFPQNLQNAPLILGLHWEGDNQAYEAYADCHVIDGFSHTDAIIVAPSISGGIWWEPRTETLILDMLDKMITSWGIDKNKVALTGYSNGAAAVWLYAAAHPDIFSAAIPVGGTYAQDAAFQIPLYVIHSLDDETYPYEGVQNVVNGSINRGSEIKLVLVSGLSHVEGCNYSPFLKEAGNWLLDEIWN